MLLANSMAKSVIISTDNKPEGSSIVQLEQKVRCLLIITVNFIDPMDNCCANNSKNVEHR